MQLDSARGLKAEFVAMLSPTVEVSSGGAMNDMYAFGVRGTRAFDVHAQAHARLARHQPVVATGIHQKKPNDFKLAIRIQRRAFEGSPPIEAIRERARGEVDLRYIGTVVKRDAHWYRRKARPVMIGASVAHHLVTAGTVGCFVRPNAKPSTVALLSNNHVLANENAAKIGDVILQPGKYDGGRPTRDRIGTLLAYRELHAHRVNVVDCALCKLDRAIEYDTDALAGVGRLGGLVREADLATVDRVEKIGRTTGHTKGRVTAFELDGVSVGYDLGQLRFNGQIEIEGMGRRAFSDGGDSGSLIFTTGNRQACGLLFAGSDQGGSNGKGLTYANPLAKVLTTLKSQLVLA